MAKKLWDLDDLCGGADIADALGVVPATVGNWRLRHADFPEPVTTVSRGNIPLFSWAEVLAWHRTYMTRRNA